MCIVVCSASMTRQENGSLRIALICALLFVVHP